VRAERQIPLPALLRPADAVLSQLSPNSPSGDNKLLTVPWADGTSVEGILQTEDGLNVADWTYPGTGTPILKARHPDYELYTAGSTHFKAGVACAEGGQVEPVLGGSLLLVVA
jgi:hypothetical protein